MGGKPSEEFAKVRHSTPMLSLAKTTSEAELRDWERRVHELTGESQVDYVCELKLDGMSLALRFDGRQAGAGPHARRRHDRRRCDAERAHGAQRSADDFAHKTLDKAGLPRDFEVRGELLMPLAAFQRMNEEREEQGLPVFANPRNATAGTVRTLEPNVTAQRRLDFFAYGCWPTDAPSSTAIRKC